MRGLLLSLVLLASCAHKPFYVVAETRAEAGNGIDPKVWTLTVYGFYLARSTHADAKGHIVFEALTDQRGTKSDLIRKYETTARFRSDFPAMILYRGLADCAGKTSQATATALDASQKPIGPASLEPVGDIVAAVCLMQAAHV